MLLCHKQTCPFYYKVGFIIFLKTSWFIAQKTLCWQQVFTVGVILKIFQYTNNRCSANQKHGFISTTPVTNDQRCLTDERLESEVTHHCWGQRCDILYCTLRPFHIQSTRLFDLAAPRINFTKVVSLHYAKRGFQNPQQMFPSLKSS